MPAKCCGQRGSSMKQSKRKITACLVAAVLLLSLVPTVALAEGETGTATVRLVVQ